MNLERYLLPTNPIAEAIVFFLLLVFLIWFLTLFYSTVTLLRMKRRLSSCTDVNSLRDAIHKAHSSENTIETSAPTLNTGTAKDVFQKYIKAKTLLESDPIATHLKALFEAGLYETRLDVSELLRHTSQRFFASNHFLRSCLGSFIVLGLLGTLVGLADSLIQFSQPLETSTKAWSNEQIRSSITGLLRQLGGAFAPSILGVALTILGVLFYSLYLRFICTPAQHLLDHITLNVWIPQLIPTTPQRLVETLKRSEEQMRQSFQSAERVAEFANEIQNEASEFNTNLKSSNKVLKQLTEVGTTLSGFATKFADGTKKLTSFQEDLRSLYKESLSNSVSLRENAEAALKEAQAFHSTVSTTLQAQGAQLQTIASSLKSYETAYLSQRQQIDQALVKLLVSVNQTLNQIDSKNKELIEQFGNPLIEKLHQKLSSVENTLRVQLSAIHQQFQRLDAPMNKAADKVAGALDAVDKRTTALKEELQRLFLQREEYIQKEITAFNGLSTKIVSLLTETASQTQVQSKNVQSLTVSIDNLQETIKSAKADRRRDRIEEKLLSGEKRDGIFRRLLGTFRRK
jgi:hypothetical protein